MFTVALTAINAGIRISSTMIRNWGGMFKRSALIYNIIGKIPNFLWIAILLLPCCVFASEFKKHLEKDKESLKYLETHEDNKRLGLFSAMFDMAEKRERASGEIPKVMHFVWLGSKPLSSSSIKNVKGWIDKHPGWRVKFWTDLGLAAPDDRMEVRSLDLFPLDELADLYERSDHLGERSQILRYAILLAEGGAYIGHDTVCLLPIDSLQESHDFFCGMELLGPRILSSTVNTSPHIIAATPQHPILKSAKRWLINQWDQVESNFPGSDPSVKFTRVKNRTFNALSVGVKESYARAGRKDVVFPPDYFSLSSKKGALYAIHDPEESESQWIGVVSITAVIGAGAFLIRRRLRKVKK